MLWGPSSWPTPTPDGPPSPPSPPRVASARSPPGWCRPSPYRCRCRAPSRCAITSAATTWPWPAFSTPCSPGTSSSQAVGSRHWTPPSPIRSSRSSPAPVIASAAARGGWARRGRGSPPPPSMTPATGPTRPPVSSTTRPPMRPRLEVRAASVGVRKAELSRGLAELEERLARHAEERQQAQSERQRLDTLLVRTDRLAAFVADRLAALEGELAGLRRRRQQQSEAAAAAATHLDAVRAERVAAERRLEEVRERARRTELDEAEARMRLEAAVETVRREFDCEPHVAVAAECPELPPATSAEARVRELERDLRLMGPINPLALEEFTALHERHTFLEGQLDDVKSSRRELAKVIRAVDAEIVQLFAAAFADVADNFSKLFETLFPGGHGRLRLTDPDDPLNTGIEVEARPHGKNVRKLSLLSGGERSLPSLAFLFAVFRSRPSPFYLLDEVEAALDDVNLHRFLDLVHEFRDEAQLLVVTHQKRTMEAGDVLYGVTMQLGGSSRVVSQRVATSA